jgi:hypothetical protein
MPPLLGRYGVIKHGASPGVIILALAMSFPVAAAEKQSEQSLGSQQQSYTPSLGVVMELIQVSHFKLWLAGNLRNWPLAEYQLSQMRATLHDCRVLFPNVAVGFSNLSKLGCRRRHQ